MDAHRTNGRPHQAVATYGGIPVEIDRELPRDVIEADEHDGKVIRFRMSEKSYRLLLGDMCLEVCACGA